MYYLQTRYYDPEIGRFISRDSIEYADPETINGLNLYAYCGNNPVMNVDPTGELFWEIFLAIAAVALLTPVGGVIAQTTVSVASYVGMSIGAIFDEEIRADMNAIGWNPFNTDENAVKAIKESIIRDRIDRIDRLNNNLKQYLSDCYIIIYGRNELDLESTAINVASEIAKCGGGA